jgi:hypothetical protein
MAVYRHFHSVRTALCAALAGVILLACPPVAWAAGQDALYTVENVEVDVTADNAVHAREKALDEAQVKAYRMLAERFYSPEQMATFVDPDPLLVSSMVQDFEVTNEQLSKVRYKGVFTVRFRPNAVRRHLPVNEYNAAQGESASTVPTLILPYFQYGQRTILWDNANIWLKAWVTPAQPAVVVSGAESAAAAAAGEPPPEQESVPAPVDKNLIVPIGDLLDVSQMPDDKALTYDPQMLDQMKARYAADRAAILVAVPKSANPDSLEISLYDARPSGPVYAQTVVVEGQPGEKAAAFYARAVIQVSAVMRGNWQHNPAAAVSVTDTAPEQPQDADHHDAPPAPDQTVSATVQQYNGRVLFSSVQEWVKLKNTLERTPGVRGVVVRGLKPREAQVSLSYSGDAVALATAMQRAGVIMRSVTGQQAGYYPGQTGSGLYEFSSAVAPRY